MDADAAFRVLQMPVRDLEHTDRAFDQICRCISINSNWRRLGGFLALSISDVYRLESYQNKRPDQLPGKTFLDTYCNQSQCSLADLMKALLRMAEVMEDSTLTQYVKYLWSDAFHHNKNRNEPN